MGRPMNICVSLFASQLGVMTLLFSQWVAGDD